MQLDMLSHRRNLNFSDLIGYFFRPTSTDDRSSHRDRVLLLFCYLLQLVRDFTAYLLFFTLKNLSESLFIDYQRVFFRIVQFKLSRYNTLYKFSSFRWKHRWNYFYQSPYLNSVTPYSPYKKRY